LIYYLFGLISTVFFGISNSYWLKANKQISFPALVFFRGIIVCTLLGILWVVLNLTGFQNKSFLNENASINEFLITILLCIICSLGLISYLKSLNYSKVSISVPISSINIFGILTAVFVLKEPFKDVYYISFALGAVGVLLTQSFTFTKFEWNKGATYSLLAAFFWGTTYTLFKYASNWLGVIPLSFILESSVLFSSFIWLKLTDKNYLKSNLVYKFENIKHYFILAILLFGGSLFYNLSIQKTPVLIINLFGYCTIIVSIFSGIVLFKEKISSKQILGIAFLFAALMIVQIFN
jgi:drug/metabolite transporter (DMT)-like permease